MNFQKKYVCGINVAAFLKKNCWVRLWQSSVVLCLACYVVLAVGVLCRSVHDGVQPWMAVEEPTVARRLSLVSAIDRNPSPTIPSILHRLDDLNCD